MPFFKAKLPGFLTALLIAGVAFELGKLVPLVGGPAFGILIGLCVATLWKFPPLVGEGIRFTSKYILQLAVILLGFDINLGSILLVGEQSIWVIFLTISIALATAYFLGRSLRLNRKLFTLIGVGTAICGGSAIAAASSAIQAEDQDISYSISTIFLFNILAVFLFPFIGHLLHLSNTGFGMWAGTAINDTSSVVAAGYSYSNAAGNFATIVKLTRSLMIVPVTLALAFLFSGQSKSTSHFQLSKVFPWFILGFLAAALIRSIPLIPADAAGFLAQAGKFLIIAALSAIGLNTNIQRFIKAGPRPLFLGAMTWLAVMLTSLGVQYITQIW